MQNLEETPVCSRRRVRRRHEDMDRHQQEGDLERNCYQENKSDPKRCQRTRPRQQQKEDERGPQRVSRALQKADREAEMAMKLEHNVTHEINELTEIVQTVAETDKNIRKQARQELERLRKLQMLYHDKKRIAQEKQRMEREMARKNRQQSWKMNANMTEDIERLVGTEWTEPCPSHGPAGGAADRQKREKREKQHLTKLRKNRVVDREEGKQREVEQPKELESEKERIDQLKNLEKEKAKLQEMEKLKKELEEKQTTLEMEERQIEIELQRKIERLIEQQRKVGTEKRKMEEKKPQEKLQLELLRVTAAETGVQVKGMEREMTDKSHTELKQIAEKNSDEEGARLQELCQNNIQIKTPMRDTPSKEIGGLMDAQRHENEESLREMERKTLNRGQKDDKDRLRERQSEDKERDLVPQNMTEAEMEEKPKEAEREEELQEVSKLPEINKKDKAYVDKTKGIKAQVEEKLQDMEAESEAEVKHQAKSGVQVVNCRQSFKSKWQICLEKEREKQRDARINANKRQRKAIEAWKEELKRREEKRKQEEEAIYWRRHPEEWKKHQEELAIKREEERRAELEKHWEEEAKGREEEKKSFPEIENEMKRERERQKETKRLKEMDKQREIENQCHPELKKQGNWRAKRRLRNRRN